MWDNVIVIFEVLIRQFIWLIMPALHTQEILMLHKELQVLKRGTKRPKLTSWDRLFFVSLLRLNERVVSNIVTISPNTVLAWHRKLAARRWTFCQKSLGCPVTEDDVRNLVIEMKTNNPAVTKNPTAAWLETVVRNALMYLEDYPKFLVSDRNCLYGEWFGKFLSDCYGITLYGTPPGTPNCNAYIERWNRTVREEPLDHRIIFGERDLRRLLREYVDYFNQARPRQSLGQDSPCRQHGIVRFDRSKVRRQRLVDGLIFSYSMAA